MQALLETGVGLERRFTLGLPMAPIEREYTARLRSLDLRSAKRAQQDDYKNLRNQIIFGVKHASFIEAVSQHKLSAIGTPRFGAAVEEKGLLVFSVEFAVQPEIDTGSYRDIHITRPAADVTEQDIDAAIQAQFGVARIGEKELRAKIGEKLEYQLAEIIRRIIKPQLMEALLVKHSFAPPEAMVAVEFESRMTRWRQRKASNPKVQIPAEEQVRFNSSRAVSLGLIFKAIIQSANINKDMNRTRRAIKYIASTQEDPEGVVKHYYQNKEMLAQVVEMIQIDMAIDWVVDKCTVVDTPSSFAQLVVSNA